MSNYKRNEKIAGRTRITGFFNLGGKKALDPYYADFKWDSESHSYLLVNGRYVAGISDAEDFVDEIPKILDHPFRLTNKLRREIRLYELNKFHEEYSFTEIEKEIRHCFSLVVDKERNIKIWKVKFPNLKQYLDKIVV